jgi:hypothetical protein
MPPVSQIHPDAPCLPQNWEGARRRLERRQRQLVPAQRLRQLVQPPFAKRERLRL